jgi:hypothetical protein
MLKQQDHTARTRCPDEPAMLCSREVSEAEAQSDRGIDVVALEKAESRSAIHLREHRSEIVIPLRRKPPNDSGRDRVERPRALLVLGASRGRAPRWECRRKNPGYNGNSRAITSTSSVTAYLAPGKRSACRAPPVRVLCFLPVPVVCSPLGRPAIDGHPVIGAWRSACRLRTS